MKKTAALLLILMAGSSLFALGMSMGLRAGAPYNTVKTSDSSWFPTSGYIWGGNLSAVVVFDVFSFVNIQVEAGYSCRSGYTFDMNGEKGQLTFASFEIPIMLKIKLPLGFGINAGPMLTFPTGKVTMKDGSGTSKMSIADSNFNTMLWGLAVGLDFALPLGKHHRLVLDARFTMDFTSLVNDSKQTRMAFTPSLGYLYKF